MKTSKLLYQGISLSLCTSLLLNGLVLTTAEASENTNGVTQQSEKYNPFADDEPIKKNNEQLTFKERLAKIMEEDKKKISGSIDNVAPGHIYIPKGTKLKVELLETANSKKYKTNQEVKFKMSENLIINGVIVIPKDTIGLGYVYEAQKAGGFGRKGVLKIAGKEIKTINNIVVPLKKGLTGQGSTDGGAVAVAAAVSLIGGIFMKGSNINYPAGTPFEVEVRENTDLEATPENLKEVMNPNKPHGIEIIVPAN